MYEGARVCCKLKAWDSKKTVCSAAFMRNRSPNFGRGQEGVMPGSGRRSERKTGCLQVQAATRSGGRTCYSEQKAYTENQSRGNGSSEGNDWQGSI